VEPAACSQDAVLTDIGERHRTQKEVNLIAKLFPQIVGLTARFVAAAADRGARGTAGRPYRFVDR
jgi:hypothetical protein